MPESTPYCGMFLNRAEAVELYKLQAQIAPTRLLPCDLPWVCYSAIDEAYRIFDVEDGHVIMMGLHEGEWVDSRSRGDVFPRLVDPDFYFPR